MDKKLKMIGLRLTEEEENILEGLAKQLKITSKTYKTKVIRHLIASANAQLGGGDTNTPSEESKQETGSAGQITATTDTGI